MLVRMRIVLTRPISKLVRMRLSRRRSRSEDGSDNKWNSRWYARANHWFSALDEASSLLFCRMTQQGFLRIATHPKITGPQSVTLRDAWRMYDRILEEPRVNFAVEPPGIEDRWRALTQTQTFSPKVWNDAYLAAFASRGGL